MSSATPSGLRRASLGLALGLSAALIVGLTPLASADPTEPVELPALPQPTELSTEGDYVVTLADAPVAAYDGDIPGYDATQPTDGDSVDLDSSDAEHYSDYLRERQDRAAARVGSTPQERYEVGVSAFTAELTGQQAAILASTDGVVSVTKNVLHKIPDDRKSTDYLGLSGPEGVWSRLGGKDNAGRGVVVGVIDSGIWPESASFAGEPLPTVGSKTTRSGGWRILSKRYEPRRIGKSIVMTKSDGGIFRGACETGEDFTADDCNSKLITARYFGDEWLRQVDPEERDDFVSPRDGEGHGSHVTSIVAGNHGVRAVVDKRDFGRISGVAPAAKIASYKVLWQAKDATESGAYTSDIVAAIDQAICDGVDVINFSITAPDDPTSPVSMAFLAAAKAGIFVSASAGNSGPTASTVQSTAPWVTTVGAHSIAPYYGTVTLGNGDQYVGISSTVDRPIGPAPLVTGSAVAATGPTAANADACAAGSLDRARAAGKIIVCARGVVDRTIKSDEVARVGGIAMVLVNLTDNTLDADLHSVPTVHVNPPASTAITAYAAKAGATATLTDGNQTTDTISYPRLATFSGRGPSLGTGGDTLKPDLVAPGVSILGAEAPRGKDDEDFQFLSGTSQSSPQVAGLAALWFGTGQEPRWSPMKVKSALMTTADDVLDDSGKPITDPYAQGAGQVVPTRMFAPGLVYDAGAGDWHRYLAGLGKDTADRAKAIDPSDLNTASIAIGKLLGSQTVTRKVTAVAPGRYSVSASMPGVDVEVSPSVLEFDRAGQTKTFRVTFTHSTATYRKATSGFLTWKRRQTNVRIPMVVTPLAVDAPGEVTAAGSSGGVSFQVTPGRSGTFTAKAAGLATGAIAGSRELAAGKAAAYPVRVPPGTKVARFTASSAEPRANIALEVYKVVNGNVTLVAQLATRGPSKSYVLPAPEPLNDVNGRNYYALQVINMANAPVTFTAWSAVVQADSGTGNFAVSPTSTDASAGDPITLSTSWSGVDDSIPYVGWVEYANGEGTAVSVN